MLIKAVSRANEIETELDKKPNKMDAFRALFFKLSNKYTTIKAEVLSGVVTA